MYLGIIIKHKITTTKSSHLTINIDDFLANGNAALGVEDLIKQSGANLLGMGFIIEKSFQEGRDRLLNENIRVESLVRLKSLGDNSIIFEE